MFAIEVQGIFTAAHALRLPNGDLEPLHYHDFHVTVTLDSATLDPIDTVMDFHEVERLLSGIVAPWQNQKLNDVEPFRVDRQGRMLNPSAERIAEQIGLRIQAAMHARFARDVSTRALRFAEVNVTEAPGCRAIWRPDPR
jgi:6-pyruvoyltetrahydropterin/6-carboxytetrahydropterin synthase